MPDTDTSQIESRLEAWGQAERARISGPAPTFMRQVRAAAPRSSILIRRVLTLSAAAAAIALAAVVALRTTPAPAPIPAQSGLTFDPVSAPAHILSAGRGRDADIADLLNTADLPSGPAAPSAPPVRASDIYCAGCTDELTRI